MLQLVALYEYKQVVQECVNLRRSQKIIAIAVILAVLTIAYLLASTEIGGRMSDPGGFVSVVSFFLAVICAFAFIISAGVGIAMYFHRRE